NRRKDNGDDAGEQGAVTIEFRPINFTSLLRGHNRNRRFKIRKNHFNVPSVAARKTFYFVNQSIILSDPHIARLVVLIGHLQLQHRRVLQGFFTDSLHLRGATSKVFADRCKKQRWLESYAGCLGKLLFRQLPPTLPWHFY